MGRKLGKLIRYGGKVMTTLHAVSCASKGFKGCTAAEKRACMQVLGRMATSMKRRR